MGGLFLQGTGLRRRHAIASWTYLFRMIEILSPSSSVALICRRFDRCCRQWPKSPPAPSAACDSGLNRLLHPRPRRPWPKSPPSPTAVAQISSYTRAGAPSQCLVLPCHSPPACSGWWRGSAVCVGGAKAAVGGGGVLCVSEGWGLDETTAKCQMVTPPVTIWPANKKFGGSVFGFGH